MAEKRPSLNVLSGPLSGRKLVLEDAVDNILIGSDPSCGFVLDTPGVSPIHARLWVDLNGATVYDTNSPNGVYVNDDRVVKEAAVRNGDILWLGPPGEEGSVLIQCILPPPPPPPAAEGSPEPAAATPPPLPSREATAPIDSGATMAFGMPAYLGDEPEMVETAPAADTEASDVDSTVVMTTSDIMDPAGPELVEHAPADASALLDVSEGLEVDEPTAVLPPPIPAPPAPAPAAPPPGAALEEQGFPDFDVEPTVAMAPPPLPPRAPAPPPPAVPEFSEFEEDMEPTVVDVPAPTIAHAAAPLAPPPAGKASAPAIKEDDAVDAATVMYRRLAAPPSPPEPAPPAVAPAPPRAAPPPAAAPKSAAAQGSPARPPAEARPPAAKAPAAARPAAPAPRARVERPAAAPAAVPAPAAARRGGSSKAPLIAGAVVVVLALGFAAYWFMRPAATPTAQASPVAPPPVSQATPPVVAARPPLTQAPAPPETQAVAPVAAPTPIPEAVTVVRSPVPSPRVAAATPPPTVAPGPRPGATPAGQKPPTAAAATPPPAAPNPAQQTAAAVANLMAQAKTASDARNYDAAVSMYDEVLKLDPHNSAATAGRTAATAARNAAHRTFVAGRTVVGTEQKSKGGLSGFDGADVVQKSADFSGRLEFAMNPPNIKPGEPYRLTVALVNDGKKAIKISGMTYTITVNGQKTGNPVMPKVKEVGPAQRVVLEDLPGVFPDATSWVAEVLVTANKGDSLKNQLTWK